MRLFALAPLVFVQSLCLCSRSPKYQKAAILVGKLEIDIRTKTKCTNRTLEVKVRKDAAEPRVYNGLELLTAVRELVAERRLGDVAEVREVTCMLSCPVGQRADLVQDARRVRYLKRERPTGRPDSVTWLSIDSVEGEIQKWLGEGTNASQDKGE